MIIHDFRCVVIKLVIAEQVGRMTHFQFRVAVHALMHSDERWRLPFDAGWLLRTIDPRNLLKARPEQVAHIRDAFLCPELGFFIHGRFMGQLGLEISAEFRRDKDNEARGPEPQLELPMGSVLSVLPPANGGLRTDQKKKRTDESPRPRLPAPPPREESGNQARSSDGEKRTRGAFALDREASDDPLWHRLWEVCGPAEMQASGMGWMIRVSLEPETIETLLRDLAATKEKVLNPAAWLNAGWLASPAGQREATRKRRSA